MTGAVLGEGTALMLKTNEFSAICTQLPIPTDSRVADC